MFPISGDFLWLWKRAKESENNLLNCSRNSDEGSTSDFYGVSICACDPSTSAQGYRAAKSKRTAKSCVCVCKDVTDWLHKSERRNLWPSNQITAINQSPFLSAYQTAHLLSSVTLHHTHSSDAYCKIIHVLSVWLPQRAKKKESLALSDRFYCGSEQEESFFFLLFSASPIFKVLSRTTNKTLQGNKKSLASNAFSGKEQNEVRDVQFIRCHFNPLGKKSISSLFISQDTKNSNPLLL